MTARFELTAPAERDLEEIFFEAKARHGQLVAERVYGNLLRSFELLAMRSKELFALLQETQRLAHHLVDRSEAALLDLRADQLLDFVGQRSEVHARQYISGAR